MASWRLDFFGRFPPVETNVFFDGTRCTVALEELATFLWGRSLVVCFLLTGDQERKKHKKQGLHWRPHVPLNIFGGNFGSRKADR